MRLSPRTACQTTIIALLSLGALGGCASRGEQDGENDPFRPTNRTIFSGNLFLDRHALRPVARAYADDVPHGVRGGIHNFLSNLDAPVILINDLAQGNVSRGWNTTERFVINTTVGGLGVFEVADGWGMPYHNADFGQTLGVWGVSPGPDVQLPLFGFSNLRDAGGRVVDAFLNPLSVASAGTSNAAIVALNVTKSGLGMVDGRARMLPVTDQVERNSLDEYATLTSLYSQNRTAFVKDGKAGFVQPEATRIMARNAAIGQTGNGAD